MGKMADIDEIRYSCGLEILHPGGIEKNRWDGENVQNK